MAQRFRGAVACGLIITALGGWACSHDRELQQHKEKIDSLSATAGAIGEAWLAESVSSTYTRTALERTYELLQQERSTLVRSPDALLDSPGAELSQAADRLARVLAATLDDVRKEDRSGARRHLSTLRPVEDHR